MSVPRTVHGWQLRAVKDVRKLIDDLLLELLDCVGFHAGGTYRHGCGL